MTAARRLTLLSFLALPKIVIRQYDLLRMKNKDYNYYGVFLLKSEKERLKNMFWDILSMPYLEGWKMYSDHCTLLHHTNQDQSSRKYLDMVIGHPIKFNVIGFGVSEYCLAAMVDLPSQNEISHITLAVAPGHKPVESNDIEDWIVFSNKKLPFMGILSRK